MIRKQNSHVDNMEKALMVWREEETRHIPLSQSLTKSQALILFSCVKADRDKTLQKQKVKASSTWFMRLKDTSCLHNIKIQCEAAGADTEVVASYPDLAKVIHEGGYTEKQIFSVKERAFY